MSYKKVALVSGGTGGIGTAICQALANEFEVIALYYKNGHHELAQQWKRQQANLGHRCEVIYADIRNFDECEAAIQLILERYNRIDALINNAGIVMDSSLKNMHSRQWEQVISSNLTSVFNLSKLVLPSMLQQNWGRIISIASVNGRKGQFGQCNYAASKSALYGFTKSLALEVAKKGITVNCISPGYIQTSMLTSLDTDILTNIIRDIPLGRLGKPEEVAAVVKFLLQDLSGFITGTNIDINGGQYLG